MCIRDRGNGASRFEVDLDSGDAIFSGTVTWASGNSTQANTAYAHSQTAHAPSNANYYVFPYTISQSETPDSVVRRNSFGNIVGNYISMSDDADPNSGSAVTEIISKTGDDYYRGASATKVRTFLNVADGATNVTNNNQLTNRMGFITSADGGNAGLLDGYDNTDFVRSGATKSVSGWVIDAFKNSNGNSPTVYLSHSSGYGMHINTYNTSGSVYALELYNSQKHLLQVWNDGVVKVDGGNQVLHAGNYLSLIHI